MDYPFGKFGDCSFSRFGSVVWQTDRQTHTDTAKHVTAATTIDMSNSSNKCGPLSINFGT